MKRRISERQLRMIIRESLASDIWSGIKTGAGRVYDYVADILDLEEPTEPGFRMTLDKLAPDVTPSITPTMKAARIRKGESQAGQFTASIVGDSQAGAELGEAISEKLKSFGFSTSIESQVGAAGSQVASMVAQVAPQSDVVFAMFGGNDSSPSSAASAVESAYTACQNAGAYLVVVGPPPATIITNTREAQAVFGPEAKDPNYHLNREGGDYPQKRVEIARAIEAAASGKVGMSAYGIAAQKSPDNPTYFEDYYPSQPDGIHCNVGAEAVAADIFDEIDFDEIVEDMKRTDTAPSVETESPSESSFDYFTSGFSGGEVTQSARSKSSISFNENQFKMMQLIEDILRREGFTPSAIAAAFANAWKESRFNPRAVGDGGKSVGLFQLNIDGAGSGMSVAERMDPVKNTERIAQTAKSSKFVEYMNSTDDIQILAAAWSRYVERPANRDVEMEERAEIAREMFGIQEDQNISQV